MHRLSPKVLLWAFAVAFILGAVAILFPDRGAPQRTITFDATEMPYGAIGYVMLAIALLFVFVGKLVTRRRR
jgi:hypothetical protein